ncbi:hypothetical protein KIPB_003158 [Kipferlia bialata]|uniref:Uncharacterized protein n=1 Tax=Kipferlia bialata TaxID=797122 RepID=A0A9K3GGH3_9EUKA|nr:hypothetical protein KIPB_003158 [Kipferlia bialata]|eukprot:g3158.t1
MSSLGSSLGDTDPPSSGARVATWGRGGPPVDPSAPLGPGPVGYSQELVDQREEAIVRLRERVQVVRESVPDYLGPAPAHISLFCAVLASEQPPAFPVELEPMPEAKHEPVAPRPPTPPPAPVKAKKGKGKGGKESRSSSRSKSRTGRSSALSKPPTPQPTEVEEEVKVPPPRCAPVVEYAVQRQVRQTLAVENTPWGTSVLVLGVPEEGPNPLRKDELCLLPASGSQVHGSALHALADSATRANLGADPLLFRQCTELLGTLRLDTFG